MDRTGVDDPEAEQNIIRAEQTDAALNPAAVQVMAQLMVMLQQLGLNVPPEAAGMAGQQAQSLATYRSMLGGVGGSPMMNSPEEQMSAPPEAMPANTPEGEAVAGPQGPQALPPGGSVQSQTLLQEGETQNRVVTRQPL